MIFTISFVFLLFLIPQLDHPLTFAQNSTNISIIPPETYSITNGNLSTPIPLGLWNIQSNGLHGTMNITSIDAEGILQGSISLYPFQSPNDPIKGYYDKNGDRITFVRTINPNATDMEVYTGYKFSNTIADCISGTGPGSCYQYSILAGTFQSFTNNQTNGTPSYLVHPNSERNTFGWYSSYIAEPCPACPK